MLFMDLPTGATGVWSGDFTLVHGGVTFAPLAGAMSLSEIPGAAGLGVDQLEIMVSGFTSAINAILATNDWHQRPAVVSRAYLDAGGNVAHVDPLFSGFMDQAPVTSADGQTYAVTLTLESSSRELERVNGRTRSDADQRSVDSADAFYGYTAAVVATKEITWGRAGPKSPFR